MGEKKQQLYVWRCYGELCRSWSMWADWSLFALNTLTKKFGKENIGLYRDDGLALIQSTSGRLADKAKKDLCAQFLQFGLKITAEVNHQLVNFLDVIILKTGVTHACIGNRTMIRYI
jgi:hypothetical protein